MSEVAPEECLRSALNCISADDRRVCNNRKHAKDPIEFAQENGRLL